MTNYLMGIDIGTSACKVAIFDYEGKSISQVTEGYAVYHKGSGSIEQDPNEWWESICICIKGSIKTARIDPGQIAGIGIAGQSWSAIPVDKNGNVLHNTPIWMDTRADDICRSTIERVGAKRILEKSGNPFEPTYSTPKILWFKKNMPDIYRNAFKFLQSNSYIGFKLTGKMTQDMSQGYGLHTFDIKKGIWNDAFCDEIGIDREKLPDIFHCNEIIGEVTKGAALLTGLVEGIPVAAGGLDAACGTLGAGVIRPGETQEQGGQAGGMSICIGDALSHPKLILSFHVIPDQWLLQGGTVGGGAFKWFKEQFGAFEESKTGKSAFEIMDEEAKYIGVGSNGLVFLPYMSGERSPIWDKDAKGVFFGIGYDKTRAHMIRAIMEGCAYALLHNLKAAEESSAKANILNAMGGAANSSIWTQIKSDVTGKQINVPSSDTATTFGAAILAGVGTGIFKSFEEAVEKTVKIKRIHEPDMKNHAIYMEYYQIYLEIYEKLKSTMSKISMINERGIS